MLLLLVDACLTAALLLLTLCAMAVGSAQQTAVERQRCAPCAGYGTVTGEGEKQRPWDGNSAFAYYPARAVLPVGVKTSTRTCSRCQGIGLIESSGAGESEESR